MHCLPRHSLLVVDAERGDGRRLLVQSDAVQRGAAAGEVEQVLLAAAGGDEHHQRPRRRQRRRRHLRVQINGEQRRDLRAEDCRLMESSREICGEQTAG